MDQLLIKIPDAAVAPSSLRALPGCGPGELRVFHAADHVETYAWLAAPADLPALQAALLAGWGGAQTTELALTTGLAGRGSGTPRPARSLGTPGSAPAGRADLGPRHP